MDEFLSYMTLGRWLIVWVIGLVIASLSTSWKEGLEGTLGFFLYMIVTIFAVVLINITVLIIFLWELAG